MENKRPAIKTKRLCLHSICDSDADKVIAILTNDEVGQTYMVPDYHSREEALKTFEALKRLSASDRHFVRGIYFENDLIGFINDVEINAAEIELGLVIHPGQKNKGFATEALTAAIQELFNLGYSAVKTGAFEENSASIRVMEKCGMLRLSEISELEYRGKVHHCLWFKIEKDLPGTLRK